MPDHLNIPDGPQLNFDAFAVPDVAAGQSPYGDLSRNAFYGPDWINLDSSLFKNFKLREGTTLQFRAESFNTFNHPNFSNPVSNMLNQSQFGQSLGASRSSPASVRCAS